MLMNRIIESRYNFILRMLRYSFNVMLFTFVLYMYTHIVTTVLLILGSYELLQMYMKNDDRYARFLLFLYWLYVVVGLSYFIYRAPSILFIMVIIIYILCSDGCSYIFGYRLSMTPMLPQYVKNYLQIRPFPFISPNKTIAGYIGTIVGGIMAYCAVSIFLHMLGKSVQLSIRMMMWSILISIAGQVFDLFESYVKRVVHVKDSSALLGSRGGVCDRLDSAIIISIMIGAMYGAI